MKQGYFHRVTSLSPTVFWINNPTREEADLAIEASATGCTCNPSYSQKMIDHPAEGPYAWALLEESIRESDDDDEAAAILQRKLIKPIMEKFQPIFEREMGGKHGYVSIQGDPIRESNADIITNEAINNRALGPNACIKIPTTQPGLVAMETLIPEGFTINATEIFGVAQAISMCELYTRTSRLAGKSPTIFLSHIAGIYDDYLKGYVDREHVDISPDILWQAGLAVARKVYALVKERRYPALFIGGGARGLHHFTEMVGGDAIVTINWKGTADQLIDLDPPVVYRLFNPVPVHVVDELMEKLPDFKRGYLEDGLSVEEYEDFGPVALFRNSFIKSWKRVLSLIKERRSMMQSVA